ncbi:hypothetical protein [Aliidiomarina quisquiliarum]|uniref:hypothetical protein n=1 Tax=Aliidiomarina quisquiliarum TaxID=2938947 RepID=UPI00208FC0D4|nr:hypothetical protein [Aliidiomarina quisquiliarum]MCO4320370.1 hypothetical protein [Aliidiomarina quisquiliarum]
MKKLNVRPCIELSFDDLSDMRIENHHIPQRALHHQTPIATMKEWQEKRPDLFYKNVINHAGPDNYILSLV